MAACRHSRNISASSRLWSEKTSHCLFSTHSFSYFFSFVFLCGFFISSLPLFVPRRLFDSPLFFFFLFPRRVVLRAREAGCVRLLVTGGSIEDSRRAIDISERLGNSFHPLFSLLSPSLSFLLCTYVCSRGARIAVYLSVCVYPCVFASSAVWGEWSAVGADQLAASRASRQTD